MGAVASRYADIIIITSDNPRGEEPMDIINDIKKGIIDPVCSIAIENRAEAIEYAAYLSRPGDVLLICGKGAENYTEIKGIKIPYSDKLTVENIMMEKLSCDE